MDDLGDVFAALKPVFGKFVKRLAIKNDTPAEYTLVTKKPSPMPQHKGQPMFFGSLVLGKGYVTLHLLPIYMNEPLTRTLSEELQKRKRGKGCFNFKKVPDPAGIADLKKLIEAASGVGKRRNGCRR